MKKSGIKVEFSKGVIKRKRGNPQWGKPAPPLDKNISPTEWDKLLSTLGITENDRLRLRSSPRVREFVRTHKNNRYIPEEVLKLFNISVEWSEFE